MTHSLAFLLGVPEEEADAALGDLVHASLGVRPAGPAEVRAVDYAYDSPATGGLYRVTGRTEDGATWSLFCKLIQHVRHWPKIVLMPEEIRADFADRLPWRSELQLWDPAVVASMPPGMRAPLLHRLIDLGDDRTSIWQEDVRHEHTGWDLPRFAAAARLLGRWNARSTAPDALAVVGDLPPGFALRMYATNAVAYRGLMPLEDDGLWSHPWLVGHAGLRADLRALGRRIPDLLDTLDVVPQCAPHGDASPQNLLFTDGGFVVIDVSFRSTHALGFDLGQLLIGLVHAGAMPAAALPETAETILRAYLSGLHDEGITDHDDAVARAFATSVLLRSGFDGFLFDLLGDDGHQARRAFDERVAMSRFLVDQFHALVG